MNNSEIELLAPAGSWDAFLAAVKNGANAIYLGGKLFNARQSANNFDIEKIREIVKYSHVRDIKVYITVNVLISDFEMQQAIDFIYDIYMSDVDGVIIQDIGLAMIVRNLFPDLELHASTQMTVYNLKGVQILGKMGFKRVVLARETPLSEIENITSNTDIEIEIFGHGALCISYSGQCLMSSMIGCRSGNRGRCAQPCRLPYELIEESSNGKISTKAKGYLLSPKDLYSLDKIKKFIEVGVRSLKIEGRMKTPEYVATVVRIYRKYIDNLGKSIEKKDIHDLTQIFNRGGFTKGYFNGYVPSNMITIEKPKNWGIFLGEVVSYNSITRLVKIKLFEPIFMGDGVEIWNGEQKSPGIVISQIMINRKMVKEAKAGEIVELGYLSGKIQKGNKVYKTSDKKLNNMARESFERGTERKILVNGKIVINTKELIYLEVTDSRYNFVKIKGEICAQKAVNTAITKERIIGQLSKTGNTPFEFNHIEVDIEDNVNIPISELNNLRRRALNDLQKLRQKTKIKEIPELYNELKNQYIHYRDSLKERNNIKNIDVSIFLYDVKYDMELWNLEAEKIYLPVIFINDNKYVDILDKCKKSGSKIYLWIPSITGRQYDKFIESNIYKFKDFDGILAGNWGTINYLLDNNINVLADYTLNVFNTNSLRVLKDMGITQATLSNELTLNQIKGIGDIEGIHKEIIVYGDIPVMTSEYCMIGDIYNTGKCSGSCSECNRKFYLKDRKGELFPIKCNPYNHKMTVFNSKKLFCAESIKQFKNLNIDTIRLNIKDEKFEQIEQIINLHKSILKNDDSVFNKLGNLLKDIEKNGYTKGHFFREV